MSKNTAADRPGHRSTTFVPSSYQELHTHYVAGRDSLVSRLVRNFLRYGTQEEFEDLTQDVFLRCMDKDVLKIYDPEKANFGGVIYFVTRTVVANYLDSKSRNPLGQLRAGSLVDTDPEDGVFEIGTYSLDRLFGNDAPDMEGRIHATRVIKALKDWARGLYETPRHKRDRSLLPLLECLEEGMKPRDIAPKLRVTASTISNWISELRNQATTLNEEAPSS